MSHVLHHNWRFNYKMSTIGGSPPARFLLQQDIFIRSIKYDPAPCLNHRYAKGLCDGVIPLIPGTGPHNTLLSRNRAPDPESPGPPAVRGIAQKNAATRLLHPGGCLKRIFVSGPDCPVSVTIKKDYFWRAARSGPIFSMTGRLAGVMMITCSPATMRSPVGLPRPG
jgi:hypothetical protein